MLCYTLLMEDFTRLRSYLSDEEIIGLSKIKDEPPHRGGVINPRRLSLSSLAKEIDLVPTGLNPLAFLCDSSLGKTLYHQGGGIYLLDPSATLVSYYLGGKEKEIVLDLCAAPGGKTISYALLHPRSLIVANDISYQRAKELEQNVVRLGLHNVIVTSNPISFFVKEFKNTFNRIILDAPCSGSGMYRKDKKMIQDWSLEKVKRLALIQKELLDQASQLLVDGGLLSYSTCSFEVEEDEEVVGEFLKKHEDFSLVRLPIEKGYKEGLIKGTIHLLPNLFRGEGHYLALLKKAGMMKNTSLTKSKEQRFGLAVYHLKNKTYLLEGLMKNMDKLNSLSLGIRLRNEDEKSELSFHLARYLKDFEARLSLPTLEQALDFLHGDSLRIDHTDTEDVLVVFNGFSLGWGRVRNRVLKNYIPKNHRLIVR